MVDRTKDQKPKTENQLIGITIGDPAGIGPEVTLKAMAQLKCRNVVLIGSKAVLQSEAKRLRLDFDSAMVIDTGPLGRFACGRVQKKCGESALAALKVGLKMLKKGEVSALVTAPVSKEALRLAGFKHPGQTEFLAEGLGATRYAMLAWTPWFKVVLVTIHLPLVLVPAKITARAVLEKILLLDEFLQLEGKAAAKIGVMALNPHAQEFSLGEEGRISQAIKKAKEKGVNVQGPLPADSIFVRLKEFDGFVAMYHDQAMIPAKLLGRGRGVNVTLGLNKTRTSPLHGVAFEIAGKGVADSTSMKSAIRLAQRLARRSG